MVEALEAAGVTADAPELPFTGFADDVAVARDAIDRAGPGVVVCGHSYGGMVVSRLRTVPGAGDPPVDQSDPAWRRIPSTYVVCRDDRAIDPQVQRTMARHATDVVEWDGDHSPFLTHPGRVASLLAGLLP